MNSTAVEEEVHELTVHYDDLTRRTTTSLLGNDPLWMREDKTDHQSIGPAIPTLAPNLTLVDDLGTTTTTNYYGTLGLDIMEDDSR